MTERSAMNDHATVTDPANTIADPKDMALDLVGAGAPTDDDLRAPVVYAYLRVSTGQQDVDNQKHGILEYANQMRLGAVVFIEDTASGRKKWRERKLGDLVNVTAKKRDTILFAETSRIARSTLQVLEVLQECAEKGVRVHMAKERRVIDDSLDSKVMVTMLGLAAEIERDMISIRTTEALAARKAAGVQLGRPKGQAVKTKLDDREMEIRGYLDKGINKRSIAKLVDCAPSTLYEWFKRKGIRGPQTKR